MKLTEHPEIVWAFEKADKKTLTDCFNELKGKIRNVLSLEGRKFVFNGKPNIRILNAILASQEEERIRESITDPKDQAIFAISTIHRKPKGGIADKRLSQTEIAEVLSKEYGIKLSQQKVSKRLGRLK